MIHQQTHQEYFYHNGNARLIVFVHGILGSPSRFRQMAERLNRQGYDCAALLLPGHGGTARDFSRTSHRQWPAYVKQRLEELKQDYQSVWLIGHSLGGLISLDCAAAGGIDGVVLINAPMAFKMSPRQVAFSIRIMLCPPGKDDPFLSAYRQEFSVSGVKLVQYPLWLRQFFGLFRYIQHTRRRLKDVRTKTLIVQSARDESVQRRSADILRRGLVNAKTELLELAQSYHGYFPEKDRQTLMDVVERFVTLQ